MVSKSVCNGERNFFFETKDCKLSCVRIIVWPIVVKEGTNTLFFCIFEYGAEFCAKSSAEPGAK